MITVPEISNGYPALNRRVLSWLRFLHTKATTRDDWSEDGKPHGWWDQTSSPPMASFPRFDLQESTYAVGLMADKTPAWREVYATILKQLAERFLTYWAAVDWLSQFGPDPRRKSYPQEWIDQLLPSHLVGKYDAPGWVANGIEPWGVQPDPIGAQGNLFFRGWLNLTQALHGYVTGEDTWGEPFMVAGVDATRFEWTQHRMVEHLVARWEENPMGSHCENTKIWPFCLSAAGLGLQLYDALYGKNAHQAYDGWLSHVKDKYFGFTKSGGLEWLTMYYDPLEKYTHRIAPHFAFALAFYMLPQSPKFAETLYRGAVRFMGWDNPSTPIVSLSPDPRFYALALVLAQELGDHSVATRLHDYSARYFEPRYFGKDDGQFGFWFHFGEKWPRGQLSALAIMADVITPGDWQSLFCTPNLEKFLEPTVEGVDYPSLGIAQAFNDKKAGFLQLTTFCGDTARHDTTTKFRVTNLPDSKKVRIVADSALYERWQILDDSTVEITTQCTVRSFQIYTGYKATAAQKAQQKPQQKGTTHHATTRQQKSGTASFQGSQTHGSPLGHILLSTKSGCSCCAF